MTNKLNNPFKIEDLIATVNNLIDTKLETLTAGNNIEIKDNIISVIDIANNTLSVGFMCPFFNNDAPEEWLHCQGQAISRTTYKDLFDVIGTTYGNGDGRTTFNLPSYTFANNVYILTVKDYIASDSLLSKISKNIIDFKPDYSYWA